MNHKRFGDPANSPGPAGELTVIRQTPLLDYRCGSREGERRNGLMKREEKGRLKERGWGKERGREWAA